MEEVNKGIHINIDSLSNPDNEMGAGLPIDGLTDSLQRIINDVAEALQSPKDYVTASLFSVASAAMGNKFRLVTDNTDVPMLWTILVGDSGVGKSQPITTMAKPLMQEQKERLQGYRAAVRAWRQAKDETQAKPIFSQLFVSDITPESLYKCMSDNPNGLIQYSDEIMSFIGDFGRYNKSGEESKYLSIWSGKPITINRKSEEPYMVDKPFLSVIGGIQPNLLGELFTTRRMVSGFSQRLLFVYPTHVKRKVYTVENTTPNISSWESVCRQLLDAPETTFSLSPSAYDKYNEYRNSLSNRMDNEDDAVKALFAKLRIYVARWAIVAHILGDDASSLQVTERDMEYSIRCMAYFEDCWRRVYKFVGAGNKQPPSVTETIQYFWSYAKKRNPNLTEQQLADTFGGSRQQVHNVVSAISKKP